MDPNDAAKLVVLDALKRDPTLFMALRHLGWIDANQIVAEFPDQLVEDDPVAAILAAAPVPTPPVVRTYEIVHEPKPWYEEPRGGWEGRQPRRSGQPVSPMDLSISRWATRARPSPAEAERARSAFAAWVEGERPYEPGIAGNID